MEPLLIVVVVVVVVAIVLLLALRGSKRRDNLRTFAENRDWRFDANLSNWRRFGFADLPLCRRGFGRRCDNVIFVDSALAEQVLLLDFSYFQQAGQYTQQMRQTVLLLHTPAADLPTFALSPENVFHRIGEWFGYDDLDFAAYPDFSNRYRLVGEDVERVRAAFGGGAVETLERLPDAAWNVESAGGWLAVYRHVKTVPADELSRFLDDALEIARAFVSR